MALYAIGDLHLAHDVDKPMNVFGHDWDDHPMQIRLAWENLVEPDDVVLIPGDISWAMTLPEAKQDLEWIGDLPGKKVLIRGNHDYWWSGISKVRQTLPDDVFAVQNDALRLNGYTICGTRGWLLPSHPKFSEHDEVIYRREIERLKLSLDAASKLGDPVIAMLHYPPTTNLQEDTPFTDLMEKYRVKACVYGHLHGLSHRFAFNGVKNGTLYALTSCDFLHFRPTQISFAPLLQD